VAVQPSRAKSTATTPDSAAQDLFTAEGAPAPAPDRAASLHANVAALAQRVSRAETDRDAWRASGMQENYLEACSRVDALNLQLDDARSTERGFIDATRVVEGLKRTL